MEFRDLPAAFGIVGACAAVAVALTACATHYAAPLPVAPAPACAVAAPTYTLDQEQQMAAWFKTVHEPIGVQVIADYGRMRKAARAACAK